ncbi:MAG: hypothetical protein ACP5QX_07275 [Caldisericaceae bacterium]
MKEKREKVKAISVNSYRNEILQRLSDWLNEREIGIRKLMKNTTDNDAMRNYRADLAFIDIVRLNLEKIVNGTGRGNPMNTVILNINSTIEECEQVVDAFEYRGYETFYDAKLKVIKTTASTERIRELAKLYKCIQSYDIVGYEVLEKAGTESCADEGN